MRKENIRRGSLTVEMACLMPLFLLVIIGSIYLCFYVHNRAWLTAAAQEAALKGCETGLMDREEGMVSAEHRARQLLQLRLFGAENLRMQSGHQGNAIQVSFYGDTISSYGNLVWHLEVEADRKIIDPVAFIWKLKGLEGLVGNREQP